MRTTIILPTYNERENIASIIDQIKIATDKVSGWQVSILVVDDHSPDGTAAIVREKMAQYPSFIALLEGQKEGLGAAYIRGMQHAIKEGAELVYEMDADFSHDPEDLARMFKEIQNGADFVIGSRYVPGGQIPPQWSLYRKANSRVGNLVARVVAGIYRVRDCTAGFRAIKTSLLKKIDVKEITTQGYGFQVSLLYEAYIRDAIIKEIPVIFVDRTHGESKLGFSDVVEFIKNAFAIRLRGFKTLIKFLMVGASGVVVNLSMFSLFTYLGISKFIASPLAIEASIIWNFLLNNAWTFRRREVSSSFRARGLKFNIVSLLSLSISYSTFLVLTLNFEDGSPLLFQAAGIIPATIVNYLTNSYWTFKEDKTKNKSQNKTKTS